MKAFPPLRLAPLLLCLSGAVPLHAGFLYNGVSPANAPWPGGTIPYVIDPALTAAQQKAYLDGIREWELAADIHFVERMTETEYARFEYDPSGPNLVSGSQPVLVEVNALTRSQIVHETGHLLGFDHEHTRPDRDTYVTVETANITPGNAFWFDIQPDGVSRGGYDFESVMHFSRNLFSTDPANLDTLTAKPGFEIYQPRMGNFALSPGDRAAAVWVYGAATLSPVVTTTADTGPGSLRAAMYYAADHPGTTITFDIPTSDPGHAAGVFTIKPTGHLPPLATDGTVIDATTQPGYAGNPVVFLDGSGVLPESGEPPGLMIYASGCTVRGLGIVRSPWVGIAMLYQNASGNTVRDCWCGVGSDGTSAAPNAKQGVQISDGAHDNTIGPGNVLSGNAEYGVWISGAATHDNKVTGSRVGTRAAGDAALPNGLGGVIVTEASTFNTIGPGNVVSGNNGAGIRLTGSGVVNNTVSGNFIGTDATGASAVSNSDAGIYIVDGAADNVVTGNFIAGNGDPFGYGIAIIGPGSDDNAIDGNQIGISAVGGALGNNFAGVAIWNDSTDNVVASNRIAHHSSAGIVLFDASAIGNTFRMNSISDHGYLGIDIRDGNHGAAAPALGSALADAGGVTIVGTLDSTPGHDFRIEFFASGAPGEGVVFLGAIDSLATDGAGHAAFSQAFPSALVVGKQITATATDEGNGDTSGFSAAVSVTALDSDFDGIPDGYESANGMTVGIDDAGGDLDHDGRTNLDEYLAGTDPQDGADFFGAESVTHAGGMVTLRFRVKPGRVYQVRSSPVLGPPAWKLLPEIHHADSELLEVTLPAAEERMFYQALRID